MSALKSTLFSALAVIVGVGMAAVSACLGLVALKAAFVPFAVMVVLMEISLALLVLPVIITFALTIAALVTLPFMALFATLKVVTLGF